MDLISYSCLLKSRDIIKMTLGVILVGLYTYQNIESASITTRNRHMQSNGGGSNILKLGMPNGESS